MAFLTLLNLLAVAISSTSAQYSGGAGSPQGLANAGGFGGNAVRSGLIPASGPTSGGSGTSNSGTDAGNVANFANSQQQQQQQRQQQFQTFQTVSVGVQSSVLAGQNNRRDFLVPSFVVVGSQGTAAPVYPEHTRVNSGILQTTTTLINTVTQTHTLRVPSTSDVWVTSVTMMKMPVTQLTTQRSYVPVAANTVTSVIRITKTPIEVVTRTEEVYPTKTLVSVYTRFVTETETVELWQNIVHRATNYEVLTVPVVETQTLLQRLFTTITVTRVVNVTSVQPAATVPVFPRSGEVTQTTTVAYNYGRY